jgi:hypothetical protein
MFAVLYSSLEQAEIAKISAWNTVAFTPSEAVAPTFICPRY